MRRISLRKRILLTLGALIAITLTGGGYTIWYTSWMDTFISSITSTDIKAVEAAAELETELAVQKGYVTYYFMDNDEQWLRQLEEHNQLFETRLEELRELISGPAAANILGRIESSYLRYVTTRDQVVALYRQGNAADGQALHQKVREQFFKIYDLCEEFKRLHHKNIDDALATSRDRVRTMNAAALTIMPVVFVLGIILAMTFMRQVLLPLRQLAQSPSRDPDAPPADEVEAVGHYVRALIENVDRTRTKLARSQIHLMQTEKLAMVGKMAAGVAHSVRNPLTSVKMRLFSLKRSLSLSQVQEEDFDVISAEIRHIDTILQNFLEFSRPPKLRPQEVSPSEVVDMALQLMHHRLDSYRIDVKVERDAPLPPVLLDPEQIKEVLVNLLSNACEVLVTGGSITIHEEQADDPALGPVEIIRMSDSGPGVPRDVADRIFEPFFSTKEEGSGLGLSIAKRIIEEHGGRITLAPREPGQGATFNIMLRSQEHAS